MRGPSRTPLVLLVLGSVATAGVVALRVSAPAAPGPASTPAPTAAPAVVEGLDAQLQRVAATVSELRGLDAPLPPPTVLDTDALAERVAELTAADLAVEDLADDTTILVLLGMLPPGTDLASLLTDALAEQVAGFYDPRTGELVVGRSTAPSGGATPGATPRLGRLDELTLAHELQHALADAVLGLPDPTGSRDPGRPDPAPTELRDDDAALAATMLVEGDATLTMERYAAEAFTLVDQLALGREAAGLVEQLEALESLPHVLRRSLELPYVDGLAYVQRLFDAGGWAAVDAAYADPPRTTAEVLFPDAPAVDAEPPALPAAPAGSTLARRATFGAVDLLLLLEAPGGDEAVGPADPRGLAAGWAGGQVGLWRGADDAPALAVALEVADPATCTTGLTGWAAALARVEGGSTSAGVPEGPTSLVTVATLPDRVVVVSCTGTTARVGVAGDRTTATDLAGPGADALG